MLCEQCTALLVELVILDEWATNEEVQAQLELHQEAMALYDEHNGGDDGIQRP